MRRAYLPRRLRLRLPATPALLFPKNEKSGTFWFTHSDHLFVQRKSIYHRAL